MVRPAATARPGGAGAAAVGGRARRRQVASFPDARPTNGPSSTRHVPAAVRRAVYERDGGQCRYVDEQGRRCTARAGLEFHHRHPFVFSGDHSPANVSLLCRAHNGLLAEVDFGRDVAARNGRSRSGPRGLRLRSAATFTAAVEEGPRPQDDGRTGQRPKALRRMGGSERPMSSRLSAGALRIPADALQAPGMNCGASGRRATASGRRAAEGAPPTRGPGAPAPRRPSRPPRPGSTPSSDATRGRRCRGRRTPPSGRKA